MKDFTCAYPRIKEILISRGISKDFLARMCFENSRYLTLCLSNGKLNLEKQNKILNALHLDPTLADWYFQKNVMVEKVEPESEFKPEPKSESATNSGIELSLSPEVKPTAEFTCPLCKENNSFEVDNLLKFKNDYVCCSKCGTLFSTKQKHLESKTLKYKNGLEVRVYSK